MKLNRAIGFLCEDMKVRVKLRFRGRQRAHKEFGFDVMNRFVKATEAFGKSDHAPKMAGDRDLHVTINPLPRDQRAKTPKAEPEAPGAAKSDDELLNEEFDETEDAAETVAPVAAVTPPAAVPDTSTVPPVVVPDVPENPAPESA